MLDVESLRVNAPRIIHLPSVDSTNRFLQRCDTVEGEVVVAMADAQSAGRGQRDARWESLPGDATFSIQLCPAGLPANRVFLLSQLLALALRRVVECCGGAAEVKWPNDILVRRRKVCGVLIESNLRGNYVRRAILGVGMNLVPRPHGFPSYPTPAASLAEFVSPADLPSPLAFVKLLLSAWNDYLIRVRNDAEASAQRDYLAALFNRNGAHEFVDSNGPFRAEVIGVSPVGELVLRTADGAQRVYPFKGVMQKVL